MRIPIRVDRDEEKIIVYDNPRLKRFIRSDAAQALVASVLNSGLVSVDPILGLFAGTLEAMFRYSAHGYDLCHRVSLSAEGSSIGSGSASISVLRSLSAEGNGTGSGSASISTS